MHVQQVAAAEGEHPGAHEGKGECDERRVRERATSRPPNSLSVMPSLSGATEPFGARARGASSHGVASAWCPGDWERRSPPVPGYAGAGRGFVRPCGRESIEQSLPDDALLASEQLTGAHRQATVDWWQRYGLRERSRTWPLGAGDGDGEFNDDRTLDRLHEVLDGPFGPGRSRARFGAVSGVRPS